MKDKTTTPLPSKQAQQTTFIYALLDPRYEGEHPKRIRYIGKSDDPKQRLSGHKSEARSGTNSHKAKWIRSLFQEGLSPTSKILAEVPVSEWENQERGYIRTFWKLGFELTNGTPGGEGCIGDLVRGKPRSPEHCRKISEAKMGHPYSRNSEKLMAHAVQMGKSWKGKKRGVRTEEHRCKLGKATAARLQKERDFIANSQFFKDYPIMEFFGRPVCPNPECKKNQVTG